MGKIKKFVPYTIKDLAVLIPHPIHWTNRWEWFWPQFIKSVPEETLAHTYIVAHRNKKEKPPVPDYLEVLKGDGVNIVVCDVGGLNPVAPTKEGLDHINERLVARIADDIQFRTDWWVPKAVEIFNEEPHVKILGKLAGPGPKYKGIKYLCYAEWLDELLNYGDYRGFSYIHGSSIIANLVVWLGYYGRIAKTMTYSGEDIAFTLYTKADGIPFKRFNHFLHRGLTFKDRLSL